MDAASGTQEHESTLPARIAALEEELHAREHVEAELRAANERLSSTIELLPDPTFLIDCEKKVIAWNHAAEELTGLAKEQALGQGDYVYALPFFGERRPILIDLLDVADPELEASYEYVRRVGDKVFAESFIPRLNGGKGAHLWGVAAPLFDSEGRRFGSIEVIRDLTELKRVETALGGSLSLTRAVLDAVEDGIIAIDRSGRVESHNRRFVELWRLPGEALGKDGWALDALASRLTDPGRLRGLMDETAAHPDVVLRGMAELEDGRIFEYRSMPQALGSTIVGRVWSFRDVTGQVGAEHNLRRSEELFKVAFFGIPDLAAITDLETGSLIEVNDGCERVLGWRRDEVLGRVVGRLPIWESREQRGRVITRISAIGDTPAGEISDVEFELRRKDGQPYIVSGSARVVEMGGRKRVLLLLRDVTERRKAERARAQLASVVEGSSDAIIGMTLDGTVTTWNAGAEALYGYADREALGRPISSLVAPTAAREVDALIDVVRAGRTVSNFEAKRTAKDGTIRHVTITLSPIRDDAGRVIGVSAITHDISERRRLEEDLRRLTVELEHRVRERTEQLEREMAESRRARDSLAQSERKYRDLVENANSIILRWDTEGRVTFLNEYGQSFFGYRADEIVGHSVIGTIVPQTESSGRDLATLMDSIARHPGEFVAHENENIRRSGERIWIAWTNRPVFEASGKLVETLSVGNDITALKQIEHELVKAKETAESADRLKSTFLATMSHELRTPLNSIIGFTGIMLQGLAGPLNDEQKKQLGMVRDSARHLHALINDVLDLSKIEAGQMKIDHSSFDFEASAAKVVDEMKPLAQKKGLELRFQVAAQVGNMVSDRRRVEQVLMNLISNALKFTDEGEVEVTAALVDDQLETSVRDTGIGIKPEDWPILFRPFQQVDIGLTRRHEGTGLGLSICRKIVELLGGSITFNSTFGVGSVFTFRLPLRAPEQR
jgi:PAS domain S-box-containing protein